MVYGQLNLIKELTLKILMTKFVTILFPFTVIVLRISLNYGPLKRKIEKIHMHLEERHNAHHLKKK
ncbi:hypothetical protein BpHYR1_030200 [Brachionus plicatilis]|uniref:Uncharacterized protein n=1 Tax=Brachionus plicatilis TaxID=10195 RepID=A0A3M7RNB5_BRAPC|nr:hypothetical protein BpHYR1_030200 [Brachionus plicatilis]